MHSQGCLFRWLCSWRNSRELRATNVRQAYVTQCPHSARPIEKKYIHNLKMDTQDISRHDVMILYHKSCAIINYLWVFLCLINVVISILYLLHTYTYIQNIYSIYKT